jgi:hypothetical protein
MVSLRSRSGQNSGPPPWLMTVCRAMIIGNATNAVHVRYFLEQQVWGGGCCSSRRSSLLLLSVL